MQPENHEPIGDAAGNDGEGAVVLGDRADVHLGDYVGFERITTNRDWRLALGKVVGFPCTRFVKVAYFDPVNRETVAQDPISEEVIRKKAEEEGRMQLWHDREALHEELTAALEEEKVATQDLFLARDATLAKQAAVADMTKAAVRQLLTSRKAVKKIPVRQWRDLRSRGEPSENVVRLMRAVMLVLYEDRATSWEAMDPIIKDKNFLDRMLAWDCSMTPMSRTRRNKVVALCSGEDVDTRSGSRRGSSVGRSRRRSTNATPRGGANEPPAVVEAHGKDVGSFGPLDTAMRAWLNAQLACSEAAERQERAIDECFAEQQEQRVELRRVNDMRVNISRVEVMMQESKCAIMGTDPSPNPIMPLEQYPTDTIFYKRTYPGSEGRFVQEVILRDAVLINFGPLANEDTEGYVRLSKAQADALRTTVHQAYIKHDADEMQDLLARKEREEDEIAQLRDRIDMLRGKPNLSEDELEELGQLEKLLEDAERRHRATLNRIAELYACGRGAREITVASRRIEAKYTRLHAKMAGDWSEILSDPQRLQEMQEALRDDICALLQIPRESVFDIDARAGSLLIDFTVKHSGELDDEELQDLVNHSDFSALSLFYEKITFKKTGPINTAEQEAQYEEEMRLLEESRRRENFSGMGIREKLEDYYNADGTLDEEFGPEVTGDVDYRKATITIPLVREDYDEYATVGPAEVYCDEDQDLSGSEEPQEDEDEAPVDSGTTHTAAYGLTGTQDIAGTDTYPATEVQQPRTIAEGEEVVEGPEVPAAAAAPAAAAYDAPDGAEGTTVERAVADTPKSVSAKNKPTSGSRKTSSSSSSSSSSSTSHHSSHSSAKKSSTPKNRAVPVDFADEL